MKATELRPGMLLKHKSNWKIPNPIKIQQVIVRPKSVWVFVNPPFDDYKFRFNLDQNVEVVNV